MKKVIVLLAAASLIAAPAVAAPNGNNCVGSAASQGEPGVVAEAVALIAALFGYNFGESVASTHCDVPWD